MDILEASEPHFIKCIKPNSLKAHDKFESPLVLEQLRYSGVLEAIKIRKSGFPIRKTHSEFWGDYWSIAKIPKPVLKKTNHIGLCEMIISKLQQTNPSFNNIKIGKSIVFLKPEEFSIVENMRNNIIQMLTKYIQTLYRMHVAIVKTRILSKARAKLRVAIIKGEENNSGNVSILGKLQTSLDKCKNQLRLRIVENNRAEALIKRLCAVDEAFKKLEFALSDGAKLKFPDIFDEYDVSSSFSYASNNMKYFLHSYIFCYRMLRASLRL